MTALHSNDFSRFFREVNDGQTPFPWQERLASRVFESGWPATLDLPTASGKTAVLEIAVFHLALEAALPTRTAPLRIAFVVDRRLIVDQAHERAQRIQRALQGSEGIAGKVAAALKSIGGDQSEPLAVEALRGGIPLESDWAKTPVQPTILLSTVDQVGSRLLFRGYGVSKSMRPVHAGLLGGDCLVFLDEAHLSEPFRQSLAWVRKYRAKPATTGSPWGFVTLSATPATADPEPFGLKDADYNHPILGPRLNASKPAELRDIGSGDSAPAYAAAARELQQCAGIQRVLVVVNRVDLARAIFEQLGQQQSILLTGRIRELDRNEIVAELQRRFGQSEQFVAVATQCIEAGVDLDFDGLVTQIAPLDALRQRFGRLNRTGREVVARAIIIAAKDETSKKPDPIYGVVLKGAWEQLKRIATPEDKRLMVDFGTRVLVEKLNAAALGENSCRPLDSPIMPPAYVDLWACTNPPPAKDPEIALFLHGAERAGADVEVVWRADLSEEGLEKQTHVVALVPPRAAEAISVPVWKVRQWLAGEQAGDMADVEGSCDAEKERLGSGRKVLQWSDGEAKAVWPNQLRPGDVIVVPSSYGGCDKWGWTGVAAPFVTDRALEAAECLKQTKIAIRLHPSLFEQEDWNVVRPLLEAYHCEPRALLDELSKLEHLPIRSEVVAFRPASIRLIAYTEDDPVSGVILSGRRRKPQSGAASTESDLVGSFGEPISLLDHTRNVVEKARKFASAARLSGSVRNALEFAAALHDAGKGDGRFQAWLSNGRPGLEVLAKSGSPCGRPKTLPERWRHEALSVRLALQHPDFLKGEEMDRELALWLIGTHHGWGRPFFPHEDPLDDRPRHIKNANGQAIAVESCPGPQRLDFDWNGFDWASLFDCLACRYGHWELSRFEAMLRLADHRASEEENAQGTCAARA